MLQLLRSLVFRLSLGLLASTGVGPLAGCKPKTIKSFAELDYGMPTRTVKLPTTKGELEVAYTEAGSGEHTILLIHGLASYIPAWKKTIPALAQHYRVIALDLPGYGKSSKGDYAYSMTFFADVIHRFLEQLGVQNVTLVGHSMGGHIAMTYALAHPERVEALVLTSPAGLETFKDGEAKWMANALTPEFTCVANEEAIYSRHRQNFYNMPKDAEFMVQDRVALSGAKELPDYCRAVSRSVTGMVDQPVFDRLSQLSMPVLVLFGQYDELIPNPFLHGGSTKRIAEQGVAQMPNAELVMFPKAGHFLQFEYPDRWNEEVLRFLAEHLPAATPEAKPAPAEHDPELAPASKAPGTDPVPGDLDDDAATAETPLDSPPPPPEDVPPPSQGAAPPTPPAPAAPAPPRSNAVAPSVPAQPDSAQPSVAPQAPAQPAPAPPGPAQPRG